MTATWERAYCCVELSELGDDEEDDWRYLTFSAADPVRATADPKAIGRFVRRVNRRLKLVRASFNGEEVVFDYTAILTGGELPSRWVVGCLALLDNVIRHARETCDREKVLE